MVVSTLRMPEELHQQLKAWARAEGRSVNDLAVEILAREAKRRKGLQALERLAAIRDRIREECGELPDSVPEIRRLREERGRG